MPVANVDTFEHDVATEISNREASPGDIASFGGDISNTPEIPKKPPIIIATIIILSLCGVVVGGIFGYLYYKKIQTINNQKIIVSQKKETPSAQLVSLSPVLDRDIGIFVTKMEHNDYGYSLTIKNYSAVFSYMLRNERLYANEVSETLNKKQGKTTEPFIFTDITSNNQNMRVGTSASTTIVYAFANPEILLISGTVDNLLALRSVILR